MVYETAVSFGMVITAFIIIYIGTKIGKKDNEAFAPLQTLFLLIGFFILFSHLGILSVIAQNESQTEVQTIVESVQAVVMWTGIFLIFYFIIITILGIVKGFGDRFSKQGRINSKERKQRKKDDYFE